MQRSLILLLNLELSLDLVVLQLLLPPLPVIGVDVAILTHPVSVEFVMRTVPRFFVAAVFMVAIVAHSLCVVLTVRVPAIVHFFTKLLLNLHLFLAVFDLGQRRLFLLGRLVDVLQVLQLFGQKLYVEVHVLVD